jgi:type I restriction enzyme, S subunit
MKQRYSTYKSSGVEWVDEIPSHWINTKIKYTSEVVTGNTPSKGNEDNYSDGTYLWIKPDGLNGFYPTNDCKERISELGVLETRLVPPLSIFINGIGNIGRFGHSDFTVSTNQQLHSIIFGEKVNKRYGLYLISILTDEMNRNSEKVVISIYTKSKLENLELILPPFPEQEQIVKYLDEKTSQVDGLISITEKKIELLKQKRTSLINEVVTKGLNHDVELKDSGVEWIGEIPKHWEVKKIGYVSRLLTGFPWKSDLFDFNDGLKIVRGENVSEGFLRWGERTRFWKLPVDNNSIYFLSENDIVVSMDGSKVGKNYVRIRKEDLPLLLHQRMCRVRVSDICNSKFLTYFIGSEMFRYHIDISKTDPMIPHITEKDIYNFKFSLPPVPEQEQIVEYIDTHTTEIDKLVSIEKRRIETLKEYRQSLISEVVTGKIKVTNN